MKKMIKAAVPVVLAALLVAVVSLPLGEAPVAYGYYDQWCGDSQYGYQVGYYDGYYYAVDNYGYYDGWCNIDFLAGYSKGRDDGFARRTLESPWGQAQQRLQRDFEYCMNNYWRWPGWSAFTCQQWFEQEWRKLQNQYGQW